MTIAPVLIALAWFDRVDARSGLARALVVLGRVPLFFYVLQCAYAKTAGFTL